MNTATLTDGRWILRLEPDVALRAKRVLTAADPSQVGEIRLSHTPEHCRDLLWLAQRYPIAIEPQAAAESAATAHTEHLRTLGDLLASHTAAIDVPMALPPRDYQAQAAAVAMHSNGLLVGDSVGLGKTCIAYACASPRVLPMVIVVQAHLTQQWLQQAAKFVPHLFAWITPGTQPCALPTRAGSGPDLIITTYSRLFGWAEVLAEYARGIVFDEVQELRHAGTVKARAAKHVARRVGFRLGLSATPIHNYGDELWNIYHILAPDRLGSSSEFLREWCKPVGGSKWAIRNPAAFGAWLRGQGLFLRRTRADVGRELPPVTTVMHEVPTDAAAIASVGDSVRALAATILDAAASNADRFTASGQLDSVLRQATGIAKAPAVAAFVQMLLSDGPVLLGGWHHAVYAIWCDAFDQAGIRYALYTGEQSPTQKIAAQRAWEAGEIDVLILSLRSGAGLDGLQVRSGAVVIGELDWSPAVHEQFIGRKARDGMAEPLMVYYLTASDGSDPVIADVLGLKRDQLDRLRDGDGPLTTLPDTAHHVRRLAEAWMARKAS